MDVALIRAAAYPDGLTVPAWPDLTREDLPGWLTWIRRVWELDTLAEAVRAASPDLAARVTDLCRDASKFTARQVRRITVSLARYLLRATSRPVPFGLFAGVAPVTLTDRASVRWGGAHSPHRRPDAVWLDGFITTLEARPDVLRTLPVTANNLGFARGDDWVIPCRHVTDTSVSDVVIRRTGAVRAALHHAQVPIVLGDLAAKLRAEYPAAPADAVEGMLTELVRRHALISSLRPAMTVTDPHLALAGQVPEAVPDLRAAPAAVDLRLDCAVSLPPAVLREAEAAASALVRLAAPRPIWDAYHGAFLDRYGPGAVIGVRELVNPDTGLGFPAGYRGSLARVPQPLLPRDTALAALAQRSALEGCREILLDDRTLAELTSTATARTAPPHTELRFSVQAATVSDLDRGAFTLTVTGAARHAGTSMGRFLYLLEPGERARFTRAFATLPTAAPGALTVQISSPPLNAKIGNVARTPVLAPLLPLGEHRREDESHLRLDDLAVTADAHRFYLLSRSRGFPVEPVMFNAVGLRHHTHPLARFLCEITTARAAPCTPFFWGHLLTRQVPFLPRLRYGRTILAPAHWNLNQGDLPGPLAPWPTWVRALESLRDSRHIPALVQLGDDDVRIRLDLTESAHRALLRDHLDRRGRATVTETDAEHGWIGGRPHDIALPLASRSPSRSPARPLPTRGYPPPEEHSPGAGAWLYAKVYGHPDSHSALLTGALPELMARWEHGPRDCWWFIRHPEPTPHLRLRIRLHHPDRYGDAARTFGTWATDQRRTGLIGDTTLDVYRPETGRFGSGRALEAAESVFAADSAVVVAQLTTRLHRQALIAASYLDIATGFLGTAGTAWLIEHAAHGGTPPLDRDVLHQARRPQPALTDILERRRAALRRYRAHLDDDRLSPALDDLLHLHHARMTGADPDSERMCLRMARSLAQQQHARTAGDPR